ncbi:hypothetical protein M7I_4964 [Glarea lozoyensis 74030]|uniref:Gfd2/YDR514C-like C-terminal domain-containing protein n=1 Tax=Glarea lozoyensis (strain ATCC 74030 / MF5533) TaxID=1104152 RepID=H0EQL0_GLAL7|nr:hypothetical protein M7I_4964 [Glarea lozoyensis 74030]
MFETVLINLNMDAPTTIASCFKYPFSNSKAPALAEGESSEKRNIVLVGHDLGGDIDYMRKVGYNVHNLGGLIDHIDTKYIHLTERNERGAWKEKMLELAEQRVAEAVEKAREAARQREEGWSSDGGGSDGGEGIKPIPTMPKGNFKAAPVTMSSDTTAATNRRNTVNWGSSNFNNTNAETGWGSSKRTGGGWGKPWENEAKHVGDLGKGLGDLTLNQKREGKPSNSPKWPINGSNTKPAPNKSSKSSRGDDWGLNNGEKTYGW